MASSGSVASPPGPNLGNYWNLKFWTTKILGANPGHQTCLYWSQQVGDPMASLRIAAAWLCWWTNLRDARMRSGMGRLRSALVVHLPSSTMVSILKPGGHEHICPTFSQEGLYHLWPWHLMQHSHMVGECRIQPSPGGNSSASPMAGVPGGSMAYVSVKITYSIVYCVYIYIYTHKHVYVYMLWNRFFCPKKCR